MLIDLPVTIIFDCQRAAPEAIAKGITKIITVRYDTEDATVVPVIIRGYLPPDGAPGQADPNDLVLGQLYDSDLKTIERRAAGSPYDYLAGTFTEEQRQAAQDKVDEEAAQEGPQE